MTAASDSHRVELRSGVQIKPHDDDIRRLFWFREEFLVVLAERTRVRDGFQYMQLVTAYCTAEEHRRKKLREERDNWKSRNG